MLKDRLGIEYLTWMSELIGNNGKGPYWKLLTKLDSVPFRSDIPLDQNRSEDGVDLRYRFGNRMGYSQVFIANNLDYRPCSVLEMMVALANRCEETIMTNPELGDRTGEWFWEMIESLGLTSFIDLDYDENRVNDILENFLNHRYEPNGKGGLFTINHPKQDMRKTEIWIQMWLYLSEK